MQYFWIKVSHLLKASSLLLLLLLGVLNLPAVAVGIFLGGLLMKRYKLSLVSGAQLSFATSFMAYLLLLLQFGTKCDNIPVAGLTVSYNGSVLWHEEYMLIENVTDFGIFRSTACSLYIKPTPSLLYRTQIVSYNKDMLSSDCNRDCSCSAEEWDPVCSDSGITYISPCMAGCLSSSGNGKNTVGLHFWF